MESDEKCCDRMSSESHDSPHEKQRGIKSSISWWISKDAVKIAVWRHRNQWCAAYGNAAIVYFNRIAVLYSKIWKIANFLSFLILIFFFSFFFWQALFKSHDGKLPQVSLALHWTFHKLAKSPANSYALPQLMRNICSHFFFSSFGGCEPSPGHVNLQAWKLSQTWPFVRSQM